MGVFRALDLNLLRVFDAVMDERSLTKAAQRLALTQPAVSNALRRLRESLGDELLVRSGHSIEPTPRALELWPMVREVLQQIRDAVEPPSFNPEASEMGFSLGMADATAITLMPHLAQIIEAQAPNVTVRVVSLSARDPRQLLDGHDLDMAIGHFPAVIADLTAQAHTDDSIAYEVRRLYQREYRCAMASSHPLAHEDLTIERYCNARHLLVNFSGAPYGFIDEALAAHGYQRKVVLTVNQYLTAARVAAQTQLLTVLPQNFVAPSGLQSQLVIRELPVPVAPVSVNAVWLKHSRNPLALQWLFEAVQQAVRQAV